MLALEVRQRGADESAQTIRARGFVPAVFYGPKKDATPISIDARALEHIWKAAGQTSIVTLKGAGDDTDTLIHDVQVHPVSGRILHVDFYVLEKGKKIRIFVPLEFTGEAPAEKLGHIISKAVHEIEIEVAPQELPHNLPVDISKLENVGDHILASQIQIPPSATLITHGDETVVSVTAFVEERIEEPAPAAAPTQEGAGVLTSDQDQSAPKGEEEKSE